MAYRQCLSVLTLVMILSLTACGGSPATTGNSPATPGESSDSTQSEQPTTGSAEGTSTGDATDTEGEQLVVGMPADGYRLDPPERANLGMYPTNAGIYETLAYVTPDYQLEPLLATEWEFVEPNTWRFKLREGVTFHNGEPFNAEAVKESMARIAKAGGGTAGLGADSVKVVDDYTIEITPERPNRRLVEQITHPTYGIIAPGSDPTTQPIGTGPFKFVEYAREDHITVERYDNYWGEPAKVPSIKFRFIPDPNTRTLALEANEVHVAFGVSREVAANLNNKPGLKLVTSPAGGYEALYVNIHGEEPYDLGSDPAVREALALGINKESIVRDVWRDNAEINSTMVPVRILGDQAGQVESIPYDAERAKQVLEQAGWVDSDGDGIRDKDGRPLSLEMVVGFPSPEIHQPMPVVVQAQLKEVGIDLRIATVPDTASYEERLQQGDGDLWAEMGSQNDANPCFLPDLLFYSKVPEGEEEAAMYASRFAPGEAFDRHIEDCRSAVSSAEVQQSAAQAMQVLINQEHVVIPIAGIFRLNGVKDTVQGFEAHPSGVNQRWEKVSLSSKR